MGSPVDTSYRTFPAADLAALRLSCLTQLKAIEGVGQTHAVSGRSTSQASFKDLVATLASVNAAIDWQNSLSNRGNRGYASRYASFNPAG